MEIEEVITPAEVVADSQEEEKEDSKKSTKVLKDVLKDIPDMEEVEQERTTKEFEEASEQDIEEENYGI